ncbi:diacylglycerol kinase family lipid kinase [Paenibacillus spiritus]|uniref:Diacylglycerol kinase family lipid kinase n=1 Tax=Paenibacillus spiritus TaxID=2496557 RepID=A0A5J5GDF1_9BACL|nr:diacylglycerol kinase family protein [Paenibacillus spiritus]KAA9005843.1 diacylglycerol kinase family lipid kinase [Paenibacillus spiritus]
MKSALLIINPSSGREEALGYVHQAERVLRDAGYEAEIKQTGGVGDATRFCLSACEAGADLVVSIGGDGTLHETINGLRGQSRLPRLGIVPLGTVNDFARALHLPLDPSEAIRTLASPHTRPVDVGVMNGQLFINVVAAGTLAESLSAVTPGDKSRMGAFAYVKEGVKELASPTSHPLIIRTGGREWTADSPLFLAALTNSVGGFERLAPDAEVDDGLLHCFLVRDLSLLRTLTAGLSLLFGNLKNHPDVTYFTAKEVSVTSSAPVRTNVDGEDGPPLPISLSLLPRRISVVVPASD